jgi:hypothetical protein
MSYDTSFAVHVDLEGYTKHMRFFVIATLVWLYK